MEKGSLLDLLKREDFKTEQLLKMAKDIASGMVYLEQKKIVHRFTKFLTLQFSSSNNLFLLIYQRFEL